MPQYPVIDKVKTGKQLKQLIKNKGYKRYPAISVTFLYTDDLPLV